MAWLRFARITLLGLALAIGAGACGTDGIQAETPTPPIVVSPELLRVEVLEVLPHDPNAFTQGLLWDGGRFYESTGLNGRSSLREVDPRTGEVRRRVDLDARYFGEGLAKVGDRLIQLTWRTEVAFVYDAFSFREIARFTYEGEGWGLCYDGTTLAMSDGSSRLTFRDPDTFAVRRTLEVRRNGRPVPRLNELACVGDRIYANVWMTDEIVVIDASGGAVVAVIDAAGLLSAAERSAADVLNGIAHDPASGDFYITGKLWPKMFRVRFVPR